MRQHACDEVCASYDSAAAVVGTPSCISPEENDGILSADDPFHSCSLSGASTDSWGMWE